MMRNKLTILQTAIDELEYEERVGGYSYYEDYDRGVTHGLKTAKDILKNLLEDERKELIDLKFETQIHFYTKSEIAYKSAQIWFEETYKE